MLTTGKSGILKIIIMRVAINLHTPLFLTLILLITQCTTPNPTVQFNKDIAFSHIRHQVSLGPRIPGNTAHKNTINWITGKLKSSEWETEVSESEIMGKVVKNVIGKRGSGRPWLILGAHYDTRIFADQDPIRENRILPVPGANDGASGVAVLLELARVFPKELLDAKYKQIWLVFFDAEDNGKIEGWDWILGSKAFVNNLESLPDAVVIIDMIGDKDLNIFMEKNSDPVLTNEIWEIANSLGYSDYFIPYLKYQILDDHIPFKDVGVPVVDIIDFDYDYWHTIEDTSDKVSAESLEIVGNTLLTWLLGSQ